jgi:TRAP-type transport system periplasmic protein
MPAQNTATRRTIGAVAAFGLLLAGAAAEAREVKLGHLAPTDDPRHEALELFAERVAEGTGGALEVQIFPNSTLGSEREMFEQLQAGVTELAVVGGIVSNFYPKWAILDMPFLWEGSEHVQRFVASDIGMAWSKEMGETLGVEMLTFFGRNPRILVSRDRPVMGIEDLAGMKVRVPEIAAYMDTWRAFGVQPVPMPASEFYMGLRLGMIDAMENPVEVMYHWKIFEVAKHLSLTDHMHGGFFFIASRSFMDSLDSDQQAVLYEAAAEAAALMNQRNAEGQASLFDLLRAEGMEIVEPDRSGFAEISKQVHELYMDRFGRDAYEKALELAGG